MTPKEKSKELVYRYWDIEDIDFLKAKQCALIAVNEIIESHYYVLTGIKPSILNYYNDIKQEIELL